MNRKVINDIIDMFDKGGRSAYFGEEVSQAEHALQAAFAAERAGADNHIIVAALLHDVGHLIHGDESAAEHGEDDLHETLGANWLQRHFGDDVAEPVRLHVAAKRYLCATDSKYFDSLSPASVLSLKIQGGPMTADEVAEYERGPYAEQAITLRRCDEAAKIPGLPTPNFEHYRPHMEAVLSNAALP